MHVFQRQTCILKIHELEVNCGQIICIWKSYIGCHFLSSSMFFQYVELPFIVLWYLIKILIIIFLFKWTFWESRAGSQNPSSLCSLSSAWCCWFVGHVWVSEINWESEWAKDFYPLVVSLGKSLSNAFRGKKYECPIIPVQLCMEAVTQLEISFRFPNFIFYSPASLIQLGENERLMLYKYVKVFFFGEHNNPVWCHSFTQQNKKRCSRKCYVITLHRC